MKWNPATKQLTHLGMGMQYESIKDKEVDLQSDLVYGISYPQAHFLVFDPQKTCCST